MEVFRHIVVEVSAHTKNEVKIGDKYIITALPHVNTAEEATEKGIVKYVPEGCDIPVGAELYFHRAITMHNVREHGVNKSNYHLEGDLYIIPFSEERNLTFGYFQDDEFIVTGNYSLLKAYPIENNHSFLYTPKQKGYEGMREDIAKMMYPTEYAEDLVGHDCFLQPRSCYMIEIDSVKYWASQDQHLMAYELSE